MKKAKPHEQQTRHWHGLSAFVPVAFALTLTGEYLAEIGVAGFLAFAPELCGIVASVLVLGLAIRNGFAPVRAAVWVLLALLALHLVFGVIANNVQVGTALIGARVYLRSVPFFLLACVLIPTNQELRQQFRLLIVIGLIQIPIAIQQKLATMNRQDLTTAKYVTSGDLTYGTFMNSAILSLFLICLSCVVFTAFLRKQISLPVMAVLLALLLFPTTINSTKATFFLLPLAIIVAVLTLPASNWRRNLLIAVVTVMSFLAVYIPIHDYLVAPRWGYGFLDFLTMEGRVQYYLLKEAEVGATGPVGRIDSLILPFETFQHDPVRLLMGYGMGSLTESAFGPQYTGEYFSRYGALLGPTASRLIWETGCIGFVMVCLLLYFVFDDARRRRVIQDNLGTLSQAWMAIVIIMFVGMFYKDILKHPTLGILFWYYSGAIVASAALPGRRAAQAPIST